MTEPENPIFDRPVFTQLPDLENRQPVEAPTPQSETSVEFNEPATRRPLLLMPTAVRQNRAVMRPLQIPLWDRAPCRFDRPGVDFFQVPVGGRDELGRTKGFADTNLVMSGMLTAPHEFSFLSVNVLYDGPAADVAVIKREGVLTLRLSMIQLLHIPLRVIDAQKPELANGDAQTLERCVAAWEKMTERIRGRLNESELRVLNAELSSILFKDSRGHKVNIGRSAARVRSLESITARIDYDWPRVQSSVSGAHIDITLVCYGLLWSPA